MLGGRYRVEGSLGGGGQGDVRAARDTWYADRPVALKRVAPETVPMLRREFAALKKLRHPALVEAIDLGTYDGETYLVESLIDGEPLGVWAGRREPMEVLAAIVPVAHALAHLHARGIVHLDVSPANVLVTSEPTPRAVLIDLGLARPIGETGASGTPGFVAPEVLEGAPATGAADVYSLAACLATALGGGDLVGWRRPKLSSIESTELRNLLAACLAEAPASRPSAIEAAIRFAEISGAEAPGLNRPLTRLPLCGRASQLEAFDVWLTEGDCTRAVTGAAGVGKSAYLDACSDRARLAGFAIFHVDASESDPLRSLMTRAVGRASDGSAIFSELAGELSDLVNDPRLPAPSGRIHTAAERAQLAVLVLDAVNREMPILVVVDDADDAPETMRQTLQILSARQAEQGVRLLMSTKRDEAAYRLEPLERGGVQEMLRLAYAQPRPDAEAEHVMKLCGGVPGVVVGALAAAAARGVELLELTLRDVADVPVAELPASLAALAAGREPMPESVVRSLAGAVEGGIAALAAALHDGTVRVEATPEGPMYRVPEVVRARLGDLPVDAQIALAQALEDAARPLEAAAAWARAGHADRAIEQLEKTPDARADDLLATLSALAASLGAEPLSVDHLHRWLELASAAADLEATRAAVVALEARGHGEWARPRLAACLIKRGDYDEAMAAIDDENASAEASAVRARALFFSGRAASARELASRSWESATGDARADLLDVLGHSAFQAGDVDAAKTALERAVLEAEQAGDGRAIGRARHALAIVLQRTGERQPALELYRASLEGADTLARLVRTLNMATLLQDTGDLISARSLYQDVLSRAVALANIREQARVGVNLANLECLLGNLSVATSLAERTLALCEEAGLVHAAVMAGLVFAEASIARQDVQAAKTQLNRVAAHLETIQDPVAVSEHALLQARVAAVQGDTALALAEVERVDAKAGAEHLLRQQAYWRARLRLALGAPPDASLESDAQEAVALAREAGDLELSWRAAAVLTRLRDRLGDGGAEESRQGARRDLDAFLARLSEEARTSYLATHARRELAGWIRSSGTASAGTLDQTSGGAAYRRLLAINRRLARESEVDSLLEVIVDTAIELLGAERGFLILREGDAVNVAVARNFDRRSLEDGRQRISRSIAAEALRAGEPLLTTNAQQDSRFANIASVAMLKVRSVICVPLRGTAQSDDPVIGALYLDHRFQERAFTDNDVELCAAFADQAAIALESARLLEQTREQERRLAAQNVRLERLNDQLRKEAAAYAAEADAALRRLREEGPAVGVGRGFERIIGASDALREALRLVDRFADTDVPVYISGESGTGKELIARAIHERSARNGKAFVSINCGAIPENLIESELFGYKRGAFTGAVRDKGGLFTAAEGGTLLLDEIGEMPPTMQVKLLRVLQEKEYRPVGATATVSANVRIVSASHRDLDELLRQGRFREDLFYRLRVVEIDVPPLRERRQDIPLLVDHFCRKISGEPAEARFSKEALARLMAHDWPGNVRELDNEVRRALALADGTVGLEDLSERMRAARAAGALILADESRGSLKEIVDGFEREVLLATLKRTGWNVRKTAQHLGVSRAALYTRLNRFGITRQARAGN